MVRSDPDGLVDVGPHPSLWRPPASPDETMREIATAYLIELRRKVDAGAPMEELRDLVDTALARIHRV